MKTSFWGLSHLISIARTMQDLNLSFEKEYELSLTQWLVLAALKDLPGCTALILCKSLSMQPSSLTQILKRLERKKLVHISSDPTDSRKKVLTLSRLGKEHLEVLAPRLKSQFGHLNFRLIAQIDKTLKAATGPAFGVRPHPSKKLKKH